jgi:hypothetical protein
MFKSFQESMMITAATLFGYMDGVSNLVTENDILFIFIVGAILLGLATMFINVFIIMAKYAYKESFRVIKIEKAKLDNMEYEDSQKKHKEKKVYKFENNSDTVYSENEFNTEEIINSDESEDKRKRFDFSSYENVIKKKKRLRKLKRKQIKENDGELFKYTPHWSIKFKEFFLNLRKNMTKNNFKKFVMKMKKYTISFFTEKKNDDEAFQYDAIETEFDESKKLIFPSKEESNTEKLKNNGKIVKIELIRR